MVLVEGVIHARKMNPGPLLRGAIGEEVVAAVVGARLVGRGPVLQDGLRNGIETVRRDHVARERLPAETPAGRGDGGERIVHLIHGAEGEQGRKITAPHSVSGNGADRG